MAPDSLSIALIAPLAAPLVPPFVGGAQVFLDDLARGLAGRGHNVTLYAARGSRLEGDPAGIELVECDPGAGQNLVDLGQAGDGPLASSFLSQGNAFLNLFLDADRRGFDLLHSHAYDWPAFAFAALCRTPTLHTLHMPSIDMAIAELIATGYRAAGRSGCVAMSQSCAESYAPFFLCEAVIHYGLNVAAVPFGKSARDDSLLYVGRMSPEKQPERAIDLALAAGRRLVLVGGVYDRSYFEMQIAPRLAAHPEILEYRGVLRREQVWRLMSRSAGLLFTSRYEAFGLVLAEAQAAGLPVVAFDQPAAREIVAEGQTGFVVNPDDIAAAVAAVGKLESIDRAACRRHVQAHFSQGTMLDRYERHYRQILGKVRN